MMFRKAVSRKSLLRLAVVMAAVSILASTTTPAFSKEPLGEPRAPHCPECAIRDSKIKTQGRMLEELQSKNEGLMRGNTLLKAKIARQTKVVKNLGRRVNLLLGRLRGVLRQLAAIFGPWRVSNASWYGPGFYGQGLAGGGVLTPNMRIFAHRTMRFGTKIQFTYRGRSVVAVAKDRGPFIAGREFDLGPGTAKALRFDGVGRVRWRILKR